MINEDEFNKWKSKLNMLSEEQVRIVFHSLKTLGKQEPVSKDTQIDTEGDWLYDGLVQACIERNLLSSASKFALTKSRGYPKYCEHAKKARKVLIDILGDDKRSNSRAMLAQLAGAALINYCEKHRFPMFASTVISQVYRVREAIEEQFPGYIQSNMFLFVLTNFANDRHRQIKTNS